MNIFVNLRELNNSQSRLFLRASKAKTIDKCFDVIEYFLWTCVLQTTPTSKTT